jgi:hypothetical protein
MHGNEIVRDITSIALAIVGLGAFAVLVSKNSNTTGVIGAGNKAFTAALGAAEAPVTRYAANPQYPTLGLPDISAGFNTSGSI